MGINERGKEIHDPEEGKKCMARYRENLYSERVEGYEDISEWVEYIKLSNVKKRVELKERYDWESFGHRDFTPVEVKNIIRSLKNNKAIGYDGISNEMLKMMDDENIITFTDILNRMYRENFVPYDWNIGMITQIWKKKEKKGDPTNYRGIAVNSNVGKVMEKLMAIRINEKISLTEYQGGGKGGSACSEFLFILESLMSKFREKGLHIVFLDVEKAFDKAWREVIMWLMKERGCGKKEWIYLETLNSENKVRVNTVFGPTDEVSIDRVIKQGAVLSPIQYAILIDEIARKLMEDNMGVFLNEINLPCLLWVDDVMVPGESYDEIQTMVNKVYDIARKFKVEFS